MVTLSVGTSASGSPDAAAAEVGGKEPVVQRPNVQPVALFALALRALTRAI